MITDVQSLIVEELIQRLGTVDAFGAQVTEDSVLRVIDAEDTAGLPDDFIIIQPGATEELERPVPTSVRERVTLNITLITRRRGFPALLRAGRRGVKAALPGARGGFGTGGVQAVAFLPETPMPPGSGRVWACQVMPLQVTYVQPLK